MISPYRIPLIIFSAATSIFFSRKKLYISYKSTFKNSKPLGGKTVELTKCNLGELDGKCHYAIDINYAIDIIFEWSHD